MWLHWKGHLKSLLLSQTSRSPFYLCRFYVSFAVINHQLWVYSTSFWVLWILLVIHWASEWSWGPFAYPYWETADSGLGFHPLSISLPFAFPLSWPPSPYKSANSLRLNWYYQNHFITLFSGNWFLNSSFVCTLNFITFFLPKLLRLLKFCLIYVLFGFLLFSHIVSFSAFLSTLIINLQMYYRWQLCRILDL